MSKRVWAKMIKERQLETEAAVRETKTRRLISEPEKTEFVVKTPNQITPRVLRVVFESLINQVPIEKYDNDCIFSFNDDSVTINFRSDN